MKIRTGFVSNSSSSSFVVAFPRRPESADDVFEMLFESKEYEINPYGTALSTRQIADWVWRDLPEQSLSAQAMVNELGNVFYSGAEMILRERSRLLPSPHERGISSEERERRYQARDIFLRQQAAAVAAAFTREVGDAFIVAFEYGDDNSDESVMEHGGIFDRLPHLAVNNH